MGRTRVPGTSRRPDREGRRTKRRKGLTVVERDGHWHIHGTARVGGRSIRVREGTSLQARADTWEDADAMRLKIEERLRDEVVRGIKRSAPVAIAAEKYFRRPRKTPVHAGDIRIIKEVTKRFGVRPLREITEDEWIEFADERHQRNKLETRERWLNTVVSFLNWCREKPRSWLDELPSFERIQEARKPKQRIARRVVELQPHLIKTMLDHAAIHLTAQLATEWSTGARVSSVLYGCRVCDLIIAPGREQITFRDTKNGDDVVAALHPYAADVLRRYLQWRGSLHDREAPLFLTHRKKIYANNGTAYGGQNKTAFNAMKRRTIRTLLRKSVTARRNADAETANKLKADARLVSSVTQHWFRHLLATSMLSSGADVRSVMDQGGWRDLGTMLGYSHDVPEHRRELVNNLPIGTEDNGPASDKKESA